MIKQLYVWFLAALMILGLTSCGSKNYISEDILTQTVVPDSKIPITILVKYAFSINTFEKAAEEIFPDIDIIQVGNYTMDMGTAEYEARLAHDDLTDIVMTWPLDIGEEYWEERLVDLSSLPLSGKYTTNMLDNISRDGKLYYIPGPSQVRGIVYNKTLFKEHGWEVPEDFEGFLTLCQTIEKSGIRSLQLGLGNPEVLDTAFTGFGYASSYSKPGDAQWIADYNNGIGSFGDHFGSALDTFQTLIDSGVLKAEDLDITYSDREQMLFTRKCVMVEDSVLLARMGGDSTGTTDEFGLMPFFNPGSDNGWARLYPVCFIGINSKLTDTANKEKYDHVLRLLEYISTPDGQTALAGDTGAMFSCLSGTQPPDVPEIDDLLPALTHKRYAVFPTLKNAQNALRKGLAGMVNGKLTASDVITMVDTENLSPPKDIPPTVIGHAAKDFTLIETGNYITDSMRDVSGCDIALFLDNGKDGKYNGKGVSARLYQGELTDKDLKRILPDLKYSEKGELCKVTMTGENLIKALEYSIPVENNRSGWFYYFSGLRMEYDPVAPAGQRIRKITDAKGNMIDLEHIYSVAIMDEIVPKELMKSCDKTGIQIYDILKQAIQKEKTITPSGDGRFTICKP